MTNIPLDQTLLIKEILYTDNYIDIYVFLQTYHKGKPSIRSTESCTIDRIHHPKQWNTMTSIIYELENNLPPKTALLNKKTCHHRLSNTDAIAETINVILLKKYSLPIHRRVRE